ncbi:hypothetical protein B0I35DRAFT_31093 [Stachybotrys elegans]|uniref:Autophagy-related protein 1 n=1 Tax=Stachybotrys elegans TaxID=80388 RepID=A0A8K0WX69_9HYPO|nr:hypothetical protein B0I35DRAFT_31093 [Stachybotrys elegans]
MDGEEPTQATQNVLDPRRVGKQNSGFTDEDVSDILCVLYPHSDSARAEVERLAREDCPHIIGRHQADGVEPDYQLEDHASRFESHLTAQSDYAIILRLSAQVKNPAAGFAFGRNTSRCDIVFENDPLRRVSNIHFRIYVNEHGNVMIEDQSTNGTFVDKLLLTTHPKDTTRPPVTKWVLESGAVVMIYLHKEIRDLTFRVRIPRRDDQYYRAYIAKVEEHYARYGLANAEAKTIRPGPSGHVDLFGATAPTPKTDVESPVARQSPVKRREPRNGRHSNEWNGSGKYNKTGSIGKGAFAMVYKVTSKYDGLPYAAKELEKRRFIKNGVLDQKVENEMKIMQKVQHPNIVRYIESFDWDDRLLIIIMEYVPGGDLGKLIADDIPLTEAMGQSMSAQLLSALGYLHAKNITHRDVKPDNILINSIEPLEVKLTDFGLSKMIDSEQTFLRTFCGTLLYCAPEVYTEYVEYDDRGMRSRGKKVRRAPGQRYSHAIDIWSLGGVLFYALTGSPPYPVKSGISHSELLHKIMTTNLNVAPLQRYNVSEIGINFIRLMLERRPEHRATVAELTSHPWLCDTEPTVEASQSYDEITDDEDLLPGQPQQQDDDFNERISDSFGEYDDEPENVDAHQMANRPRLFGEVGNSAFGSSGVLPAQYLNLVADDDSIDPSVDVISDSEDSTKPKNDGLSRLRRDSTAIKQSADQLQSLIADVASQSLGNDNPAPAPAPSHVSRQSLDFNSSKRKPVSLDSSDEFDENHPPQKPTMKRFKSEIQIDELSDVALEEYKLLASVPQISRRGMGRTIDCPVSKAVFWEQDLRTWHLNYPEMTQLQLDAFTQAASLRGEEFGPGKSPLWDLAMKYFPPTANRPEQQATRAGLRRDDRQMMEIDEFPSTAAPAEEVPMPDTQPVPGAPIVVPVSANPSERIVGLLDSDSSSCLQGISIPVKDILTSFGRSPENTKIFEPPTEPRVPKNAFKIMLWKNDSDPSRDPVKAPLPWLRGNGEQGDSYSFWISTKATLGIRINGYHLASYDTKNPGAPSRYWARIHHEDNIVIWGSSESGSQTKLIFRCFWGASSKPRGANKAPEIAPGPLAQNLDHACQRAEKRIRDAAERQRREAESRAEDGFRMAHIQLERNKSHEFEERRRNAMEFLISKGALTSRKGSPASALSVPNSNRA